MLATAAVLASACTAHAETHDHFEFEAGTKTPFQNGVALCRQVCIYSGVSGAFTSLGLVRAANAAWPVLNFHILAGIWLTAERKWQARCIKRKHRLCT